MVAAVATVFPYVMENFPITKASKPTPHPFPL